MTRLAFSHSLKGTLTHISGALSLHSILLVFCLPSSNPLAYPNSDFSLFNTVRQFGSFWVFPVYSIVQKLTLGRKLWQSQGSCMSSFSLGLQSVVPCLKSIVSYILFSVLFGYGKKIRPDPVIASWLVSMSLEIYFNHDIFYLFTTFNKYLWDTYCGNLDISK